MRGADTINRLGQWSDPFVYTPTSITNNFYCTIWKHDDVAYTQLLNYICYPDSSLIVLFLCVCTVAALVTSSLSPPGTPPPLSTTPAATGE